MRQFAGVPKNLSRGLGYVAGLAVIAAVAYLASFVPNADWYGTYDPVGRGLFEGHSPYEHPLYVNPPWAVVLLIPFVLFPPALARGLVLIGSVAALIYILFRLRAPRLAAIALLLSPTAIGSLLAANLDAFVLLGAFLPPAWGLLILMIKPQIGSGAAFYHLAESLRADRKIFTAIRTLAPLGIAYLLGGLLFPIWIERMIHKPENVWNRSLFPYGIPLGVLLLGLALRKRNAFFALAATPFFSPYITFYTYLVTQIGLLHKDVEDFVRRDRLHIFLCIFLWVILLMFRL